MKEFLQWWLGIEAVGLVAFPLAFSFFRRLPDRGFAFSKVGRPAASGLRTMDWRDRGSVPQQPWLGAPAVGCDGRTVAVRRRLGRGFGSDVYRDCGNTATDARVARALLDKYEVQCVYVGRVERSRYDEGGLAKFRDFMVPVFQNEAVAIYRMPQAAAARASP